MAKNVKCYLWILLHFHKHGVDCFPIFNEKEPTNKQCIKEIELNGGQYEPSVDEYFKIRGPFGDIVEYYNKFLGQVRKREAILDFLIRNQMLY